MDSNLDSPSETTFSKPSKHTVRRNYRRRSPISDDASSDGSPEHNNRSSPNLSREDFGKGSENQLRRQDDGKESNRDSAGSYCGRSSDPNRHSDRQSRNSKGYYGQADYIKDAKHADDEERINLKLSSHSDRESRGSAHLDHVRSRDYSRHFDKKSHEKYGSEHRSKDKERGSKILKYQKYKDDSSSERFGSGRSHGRFEDMERERDRHTVDRDSQDEKRDHRRSSRDSRSERNLSYEESRGRRSDSFSRRDDSKHREGRGYKSDLKETDDEKIVRDQRKKYDDTETKRSKDRVIEEPTERSENKYNIRSEDQESTAKRPKFFNLEKGITGRKDVSMFTTASDGRELSSSKQVQYGKVENDINAAKVAAMKAAELVNKNIGGAGPVGYMTADQKKKLLWGNKKNTTAEEAGHRWDTAMFPDQERQEKFKKLMGVKGEVKSENKHDSQEGTDPLRAEKQKELQQDLEKQYTVGLRRRDGRTVGLGL